MAGEAGGRALLAAGGLYYPAPRANGRQGVLRRGRAMSVAPNSNRKESLMARISRLAMIAAVAAAGVLTFGAQPQAAGVKAGVLTCHETSGWGFIIGSTRDLSCVFSHPNGPPEPSPRDVERAYYPDAAHLIVSLENPQKPVTHAFRIIDGRVYEIEVHAIV